MEERILELETQAAYQGKLLNELDGVVQEIAKRLGKVEQKVRRLEETQLELRGDLEPHNTQPPHY